MAVRRKQLGQVSRRVPKPDVELPTRKSKPKTNLSDYAVLLYGEKKIGKTSLASQFDDAIFLMCEPGGKALRIYQVPVRDWATLVAYVDKLEEDTERFSNVVIDTVDLAYTLCFEHVCRERGIDHPQEERDFGRSWQLITEEFSRQMERLIRMARGTIFISHDVVRQFEQRDGRTWDRIQPSMASQASRYLEGVVDLIAYYGYFGRSRRLVIRGDETIVAGCRLVENFVTVEGEPVQAIPAGRSADEAYANFLAAFNNQQSGTGGEIFKRAAKK